jgi:hypothetical protein
LRASSRSSETLAFGPLAPALACSANSSVDPAFIAPALIGTAAARKRVMLPLHRSIVPHHAGLRLRDARRSRRHAGERVRPFSYAFWKQARATGLEGDCGITAGDEPAAALRKLDGFLCELKELQIRDGLHVFGRSPDDERLHSLLIAFARPGRGTAPQDASISGTGWRAW